MEVILEGIKYFALFWAISSILTEFRDYIAYYYPIALKVSLCQKCACFWLVTAITLNPFIGAIASFLMHIYENYFKINITL